MTYKPLPLASSHCDALKRAPEQPAPGQPHSQPHTFGDLRLRFAAWMHRHPRLTGAAILATTATALLLLMHLLDWALPTSDGWAIYWPYDGIVVAVLLLTERRYWHWIVGGFLCAAVRSELSSHEPFAEMATDVLNNVAEILIAAFCLPAFRNLRQWMMEPHLAWRFTAFAIVLGPAITSLPVAWYFNTTFHTGFWYLAKKWAFADALGTAQWVPLVVILFSRETYALLRPRALPQTVILLAGLVAATWFSFGQGRYPLAFVPYPMLLFVALRLGFPGAVIGANALTLIASYLSLHGRGPFFAIAHSWSDQQTVLLQVYSTLAMLFVLPLSIILVERHNFEQQLQQALADMKNLASVDQLTGIANRRQFDQILNSEWHRALREGKPIALLMIDADLFKSFNDRYGHIAGDGCLRDIAAALAAEPLRPQDLVARYGGEEFAAILPGAPVEVAEEVSQKIRRAVFATNIPHERNPLGKVTISIGCASVVPSSDMLPEQLIAAADRALYKAKESGRNRVCSEAAKPRAEHLRRPA